MKTLFENVWFKLFIAAFVLTLHILFNTIGVSYWSGNDAAFEVHWLFGLFIQGLFYFAWTSAINWFIVDFKRKRNRPRFKIVRHPHIDKATLHYAIKESHGIFKKYYYLIDLDDGRVAYWKSKNSALDYVQRLKNRTV